MRHRSIGFEGCSRYQSDCCKERRPKDRSVHKWGDPNINILFVGIPKWVPVILETTKSCMKTLLLVAVLKALRAAFILHLAGYWKAHHSKGRWEMIIIGSLLLKIGFAG